MMIGFQRDDDDSYSDDEVSIGLDIVVSGRVFCERELFSPIFPCFIAIIVVLCVSDCDPLRSGLKGLPAAGFNSHLQGLL